MPSLTLTGSPTFNGDSTCTIDGTDRVQAPATLVSTVQAWFAARVTTGFAFDTVGDKILSGWTSPSFGEELVVYYRASTDQWVTLRRITGVSTRASSAAQTFLTGTTHTIVGTWSATEIKISIDGGAFVSAGVSGVLPAFEALFEIGSEGGGGQANAAFLWACGGTGTLSDADAATIHAFGNSDPPIVVLPGTPTWRWSAESSTYEVPAAGATRFYLRDDTSELGASILGAGTVAKLASTTRGSGLIASDATATVLGPTTGQRIKKTSNSVYFVTEPLNAVSLGGVISVNLWMDENGAAANAGAQLNIEVLNQNGSVASFWTSSEKGTELPVAGRTAQSWTFDPAGLSLTQGQRLAFEVFFNDAGGTMAAGQTVTLGYSGSGAAADGDSWVELPETITLASVGSPPTNTTAAQVSGTSQVGALLTVAQQGVWVGATSIAYQWQRSPTLAGPWTDITDAIATTYTLVGADLGFFVRVVETASNTDGSTSANSNASYENVLPLTTPKPVDGEIGFATGAPFIFRTQAQQQTELDDMVTLAPTSYVRFEANWPSIETSKGSFTWTLYDRLLEDVESRGLSLILVPLRTPAWARSGGTADSPPTLNSDFGDFCTALVNRYRPGGTAGRNVDVWEIWNEPNLQQFWGGTPNVTKYAGMLTAAYDAIKAVDPSATVLTGGLAPYGQYGESTSAGVNPKTYLEGIYAAGAGSKFDGLGVHTYTSVDVHDYELSAYSGWSDLESNPVNYRTILAANGQSSKAIWVTEHGIPIGQSRASGIVDEQWQADFVTEGYRRWAAFTWPRGALLFYSHRPENVPEPFGLLTSQATPLLRRRSWYAMRDFVRGPADPVQPLALPVLVKAKAVDNRTSRLRRLAKAKLRPPVVVGAAAAVAPLARPPLVRTSAVGNRLSRLRRIPRSMLRPPVVVTAAGAVAPHARRTLVKTAALLNRHSLRRRPARSRLRAPTVVITGAPFGYYTSTTLNRVEAFLLSGEVVAVFPFYPASAAEAGLMDELMLNYPTIERHDPF